MDAIAKSMAYIMLWLILMGDPVIIASSLEGIDTPTPEMTLTLEPSFTPTLEPTFTPTSTFTPMPAMDNIPPAKYDYDCQASDGVVCVNTSMEFDQKVAHTLFMEGTGDGLQLLVDLVQVMHNRAIAAWECSINECGVENLESINPQKIPWSQITDDQARRLILYILSIPYTSRGETHPAWNGWSQEMEMGKIQELYPRKHKNYLYTVQAVNDWLQNCVGYDHEDGQDTCIFLHLDNGKVLRPQHPICAENVLYVYATTNRLLGGDAPVVAYDKMDYGTFVIYVQFLTLSGAQFDKSR
jgi:hypothetical protein